MDRIAGDSNTVMSDRPGVVAVVAGGVPALVSAGPITGSVVITRATYTQRTGYQIMHTFSDRVFVTLYTDRVTESTVEGLMLPDQCELGGLASLDGYRSRRGSPSVIHISMAGDSFSGLVVGYDKWVTASGAFDYPTISFRLTLLSH